MARKDDFAEVKAFFEQQRDIQDRAFQDFNGLITRANRRRLRLSDQERAELHGIYRRDKLDLLDKIMAGGGREEYPIKQLFEVINKDRDRLKFELSKADVERIYVAVLDAELQHRDKRPERMTHVAWKELDKIIAERMD